MAKTYKIFSGRRKFGIEIETTGNISSKKIRETILSVDHKHSVRLIGYQESLSNFMSWHIKPDYSCGEPGREITSFIATTADLPYILKVVSALNKLGLVVDKNCGFHVHVDVSDISPSQTGVLISHWIKMEKILYAMLPPYRRKQANEYFNPIARVLREKVDVRGSFIMLKHPKVFYDILVPKDFNTKSSDRFVSLNILNYASMIEYEDHSRATIELRIPEGTLDPEDIEGWLIFFIHAVNNLTSLCPPTDLRSYEIDEFFKISGFGSKGLKGRLLKTKRWIAKRIARFSNSNLNKKYSFN